MSEDSVTTPDDDADRDQQLEAVIADYIRACESGLSPDRREILERHPEHADELRQFFGQRDRMNQMAEPIRGFGDALAQAVGPGQQLSYVGNYELLEEIARGGMGVVYKARQTTLGRIVAVKMIVSGRLATEQDVQRFHVEAEAAAGLQHPNIVSIHEVGQHEGFHYFSMDYVEGRDLSAILRENLLPAKQAATYVRQMAEAIHYAHQQGTLHRDLKPSNILIDSHDQVRITDFGLAMRVEGNSDLTRTGQIVGTPSYMPPEQARGQRSLIGPGSDVYALGAILYECLTGRPPFRSDSVIETIQQVIHVEAASPRLLNPGVVRDLETICLKCLQKDPHRRYGTAQSLAGDLQRYLDGRPILARPVGSIERTWCWCRRNPTVASLLATVAMSLIVGTAVSSYFAIEASRRAKAEAFERGRANDKAVDALREKGIADIARGEVEANAILAEDRRKEAERNSKLLRRALYFSDIKLVQSAWEAGQFETAGDLLDQHRPHPGDDDLRGFEWWYWNRRSHDQRTLKGHRSDVIRVAFCQDQTRIASESADNTVKFWDVSTGKEIRSFKISGVNAVAFSEDGTRIASSSGNSTVVLWDANTGRETNTLKGHSNSISSIAFSPDSARIASASADKTVKLWNTKTGQEILTLHGNTENVRCVAFSSDGLRIATGSADGTVKLWETTTGLEITTFKVPTDAVESMTFSPNGRQIASVSNDISVKLWDVDTGQESLSFNGHADTVWAIAFSPDGARIASASEDKTIKVWNAVTGLESFTLKGHTDVVNCVAFSPDGLRIVSGSDDDTVKHWDAVTGDETLTIKASTEYRTGLAPTGHIISEPMKNILSLAFSPDGTRLVSGSYDHVVKLWDMTTGQTTHTLEGHTGPVFSVAFSPDGTRIASASLDGSVKLWDADTGQERLTFKGHREYVWNVAFSPDSTRIVSASNTTIKLWNAATGQELLTLDGQTGHGYRYRGIRSVAFSPDGMRIVSGNAVSKEVKVWDVVTGQAIQTLTGHTGAVLSVAYSPDGTRIASASADRTVKLWSTNTGDELLTFKGHEHLVPSVVFTPDGTRIVSGSGHKLHLQMGDWIEGDYPGDLKVWDAETGQEMLTLKGHTDPIICLAISADGTRIASTSFDGMIKVWHAPRVGIR